MALLHYTIVVCLTILNLFVVINGLWYKPQSEEHESHNAWTQKQLCRKTERLFVRSCLQNPDRNLCLKLQRMLKRGRCIPACRMSAACEESEQMCTADCDEGNVVPGLCGQNEKCCLTDTGMDECPTSDTGVTCEPADTCTGSGVTVDSGFACSTGEGQVCCRRECPESESGVSCETAGECVASSGVTPDTGFACMASGDVCCRRTCPTTDAGVSCESSADACSGAGTTVNSSLSCPTQGQVCCRRVCPVSPGNVNCEPKCSDSFFLLQPPLPCPNEGDLCCEIGLGRR